MSVVDKGDLQVASRLFSASPQRRQLPSYEFATAAGDFLAGPPGSPCDLNGDAGASSTFEPAGSMRRAELSRPLGGWPKRAADIVIALVALVLAAPVMLIAACLIRTSSGGPVLFSHSRVGYQGKPFDCYKFRTMVLDADGALADHLARYPEAAREWSETRKLRRDPRITRLGQVLRKSSIDELPQLINILRGDMSCVGPRPIVTEELERYGTYAGDYLSTRPGLTGLWQVTGRSSTDFASRVSLDSHYVRNWSLITDLAILARTTVAVMRLSEVC